MNSSFYNNAGMKRIGAVNAFFAAFSDKTIGFKYNISHVISLYCFASKVTKKCGLIKDFDVFAGIVDGISASGGTKMHECMDRAIEDLI